MALEQHKVGGEDDVAHEKKCVGVEQDHVLHDVQVDDLPGVHEEDVQHDVQYVQGDEELGVEDVDQDVQGDEGVEDVDQGEQEDEELGVENVQHDVQEDEVLDVCVEDVGHCVLEEGVDGLPGVARMDEQHGVHGDEGLGVEHVLHGV